MLKKTPLLCLALLLFSLTSACDGEFALPGLSGPGAGGRPPAFKALGQGFAYAAMGHGFDADNKLLLIGQGETIRWDAGADTFERFGGEVAITGGRIDLDGKGTLYLNSRGSDVFALKSGSDTWQTMDWEPPAPPAPAVFRVGAKGLAVGWDGQQVVVALSQDQDNAASQTYHFFKRPDASAPLQPWFTWPIKGGKPGISSLPDALHLRRDGTLLIDTLEGFYVVPPGGSAAEPLVDCSKLLNQYCGRGALLMHPALNTAYLALATTAQTRLYALPETTQFPVVPTELATLQHVGQEVNVQLDRTGRLWSTRTDKKSLEIDTPPYFLDVSTVSLFENKAWKTRKTFTTPSSCCVLGPDEMLYSFGFQLPGGALVPQGVYGLKL